MSLKYSHTQKNPINPNLIWKTAKKDKNDQDMNRLKT